MSQVDPFVCPTCGNPITNERFCPGCGTNLARKRHLPKQSAYLDDQAGLERDRDREEALRALLSPARIDGWVRKRYEWIAADLDDEETALTAAKCDIRGLGYLVTPSLVLLTEKRVWIATAAEHLAFPYSDVTGLRRSTGLAGRKLILSRPDDHMTWRAIEPVGRWKKLEHELLARTRIARPDHVTGSD